LGEIAFGFFPSLQTILKAERWSLAEWRGLPERSEELQAVTIQLQRLVVWSF